jgi:hypothetical protein
MSATELCRQWLTESSGEIHGASHDIYGYRRIYTEVTMATGVKCSPRLISVLMTPRGIYGLPGEARSSDYAGLSPPAIWSTVISSTATE